MSHRLEKESVKNTHPGVQHIITSRSFLCKLVCFEIGSRGLITKENKVTTTHLYSNMLINRLKANPLPVHVENCILTSYVIYTIPATNPPGQTPHTYNLKLVWHIRKTLLGGGGEEKIKWLKRLNDRLWECWIHCCNTRGRDMLIWNACKWVRSPLTLSY